MAIKSKAGLADRYKLSFKRTILFFRVCVCGCLERYMK